MKWKMYPAPYPLPHLLAEQHLVTGGDPFPQAGNFRDIETKPYAQGIQQLLGRVDQPLALAIGRDLPGHSANLDVVALRCEPLTGQGLDKG